MDMTAKSLAELEAELEAAKAQIARREKLVPYQDNGGDSGIAFYAIEEDCILVQFKASDRVYDYTVEDVGGKENLELAKEAARQGKNLNKLLNRMRKLVELREQYEEEELLERYGAQALRALLSS